MAYLPMLFPALEVPAIEEGLELEILSKMRKGERVAKFISNLLDFWHQGIIFFIFWILVPEK